MVNFRHFLILFFFIFVNVHASQRITPVEGNKICENIGNAHPFSVQDPEINGQERHSIILHINGKLQSGENHNIWFLMRSIERTDQTVSQVKTNHTTKKLIYKNGALQLVGKKAAYANQNQNSSLKPKEYANTIVPRSIVWAKKEEKKYTEGFNTDRMAEKDETQRFCSTLIEKYGKKIILIKTRRKHIDRCPTIEGNQDIDLDCLPSSKYPMDIYFDLNTLPDFPKQSPKEVLPTAQTPPHEHQTAPQTTEIVCSKCQQISSTPAPTNQERKKIIDQSSFFSSNKMMAFGFVSLIAAAIFYNFFEITIKLKK